MDREKLPAWATNTADAEVAVCIGMELGEQWGEWPDEVEDHRFIEGVVIDLADIFMEDHQSDDLDYWAERVFLDEIMKLVQKFMRAWKADPDYVNECSRAASSKGPDLRTFIENPKPFKPAIKEYPVKIVLRALFNMSNTWNAEQFMYGVYGQSPEKSPGYTTEKFTKFQKSPVKFWWAELDLAHRVVFEELVAESIAKHPEWFEDEC